MTRERAIKELTELLPEEFLMEYADAIKMGIEALERDQCGDCISREKALQIIRAWFDREATPSDLKNEIEQLPPVTPQPKMGRWIEENPPMVERYPFCSECGFVNPFENALIYCPNCGCKMSEIPTGQIVANGELYPGEFDDPLAEEGSEE